MSELAISKQIIIKHAHTKATFYRQKTLNSNNQMSSLYNKHLNMIHYGNLTSSQNDFEDSYFDCVLLNNNGMSPPCT